MWVHLTQGTQWAFEGFNLIIFSVWLCSPRSGLLYLWACLYIVPAWSISQTWVKNVKKNFSQCTGQTNMCGTSFQNESKNTHFKKLSDRFWRKTHMGKVMKTNTMRYLKKMSFFLLQWGCWSTKWCDKLKVIVY